MFFEVVSMHDVTVYKARRRELIDLLRASKQVDDKSIIVLHSGFESEEVPYCVDSSFYYFTGVKEPGVVLVIAMNGVTTLHMPQYAGNRAQWVIQELDKNDACAQRIGIDRIEFLGNSIVGYSISRDGNIDAYSLFAEKLQALGDAGATVFCCFSSLKSGYHNQVLFMHFILQHVPVSHTLLADCSFAISQLRRRKDMEEIQMIYEAVRVTTIAQEAAVNTIGENVCESEVHAGIEYVMITEHARPAFPSIVGSGQFSTVLHYNANNNVMKAGDLVVVDIGARKNQYCADITRTYPVSGVFSDRQRFLYSIVYDTQAYIADLAAPGYWLNNPQHPEKSLRHLAQKFLAEKGYDQFFVHGIGHFLGLDVHDVGDASCPLQEGDVITIEPGIYITDEKIGIRIEDNYWIVANGAVCLSEDIPKTIDAIELLMKQRNLTPSAEDYDAGDLALDDSDIDYMVS